MVCGRDLPGVVLPRCREVKPPGCNKFIGTFGGEASASTAAPAAKAHCRAGGMNPRPLDPKRAKAVSGRLVTSIEVVYLIFAV